MDIRTDLAMTLVSDLLDAPELLLERFGGALLLVAADMQPVWMDL